MNFPYSPRSWEREIAVALPLPLPVGLAHTVGSEVWMLLWEASKKCSGNPNANANERR